MREHLLPARLSRMLCLLVSGAFLATTVVTAIDAQTQNTTQQKSQQETVQTAQQPAQQTSQSKTAQTTQQQAQQKSQSTAPHTTQQQPAQQKSLQKTAQTAQPKTQKKTQAKSQTSSSKTKAKTTTVTPAAARADSIRNARLADSLRAVARASFIADSLRRADSLAQVQAEQVRLRALRYVRNDAFGVGERLVFDVNYGFITAGEATMAVTRYDSIAGRKCFRIEFGVNSLPSFSWIYKVEDRYLTFIDTDAIVPWRFEQHIREGSYSRDFIADFDHHKLVARTSEGEYPIPKYVHDIMSAFYFARTVDYSNMKKGDSLMLHNFYKNKSYDLVVKVLGRQELEVAAGTFRTIVVEPLVMEGGLFKSEGRIVIWLTDDDRKIPIRVNTEVVIGSIDTELREYSGLRGPLQSRIR